MKKKTKEMLCTLGILAGIIIVSVHFVTEKPLDFTKQPEYELQLEDAIFRKNKEIENENKQDFLL